MKTFVMIKPDAIEANLVGTCIKAFEDSGLHIVDIKKVFLDDNKAKELYQEHKEKEFFGKLIDFIGNKDVIPILLEGKDAINKGREVVKKLREQYASKEHTSANVVHGSDSEASFDREHQLFFDKKNGKYDNVNLLMEMCVDCGRLGSIDSQFVIDKLSLAKLVYLKPNIYFCEPFGKHSEIQTSFDDEYFKINIISDKKSVVESATLYGKNLYETLEELIWDDEAFKESLDEYDKEPLSNKEYIDILYQYLNIN